MKPTPEHERAMRVAAEMAVNQRLFFMVVMSSLTAAGLSGKDGARRLRDMADIYEQTGDNIAYAARMMED